MSFNTAPDTAETDTTFTLGPGEKMTLTLYNAAGKGLLPGVIALIQQVVTGAAVPVTLDALTATRGTLVWEAEGDWNIKKLASAEAVGVSGVGGS